jgi:putative ABC transport system ATP-binding protein
MIVEISRVGKIFRTATRELEVLHDVSLAIPAGQFTALVGSSGSGKSTLLGLIAGLDAPTSGSIRVDGDEISNLGENALAVLRGRKIGYVFQSFQLIPTLTALENVQLPADLRGDPAPLARRHARELLHAVGLAERATHYPVQLSGGEQQRVALARAFITRPKLLLADEPTGNLDSANGQRVLELLMALQSEAGATLLLVTHDPLLASRADRVVTLADGRIVADRPATGSTCHAGKP